MPTVWFMVDDTDSRLNYTETQEDIFSRLSGSETGPTYNNTLCSAEGNTSVSFHFNGEFFKFGVYGSLVGSEASVLESPFCAIECTLDGAPTEVFQQTTQLAATNNNVLACRNIADNSTIHSSSGEHELIISWSLDYVTYESLVNPAIDGEILQAGNLDVANVTDYNMLTFGPNWTHISGPEGTNTPLEISYFYVTSLTKAEQQSLTSSRHLKSGVIMGAVLGTIIPIMLLTVAIAVAWTRRKSRQRRALRMLAPFPFISQTPHSVLPKQLFGQLVLMLPTSKKNINVLAAGEAENNDGDRPALLQLEQLTPQQQQVQAQLLTVHTDSGLRLTGEESLEEIYEVPPGYTES
ncbi:hypothetical protein BT96DRAFT_922712 [Gymnopus androsaceus JB14]|uniref:Uncharacterized protein n=1 Tax=Gymnopus androsaceus JB14 TaxID=1447944 RepID=A0A6A4HD69_9AGAR|nr:hypothetical protein BT96DRAFT_922712 [Gymnopus androsaceus JB14]